MATFTQSQVQPGGYLFKLPSELRNAIYEELYPNRRFTAYTVAGKIFKTEIFKWNSFNHSAALLATCQTIYAEASSIFYANSELRTLTYLDGYWNSENNVKLHKLYECMSFTRVAKLTLSVELGPVIEWENGKGRTHLNQTIAQISGASGIKSLHLAFKTDPIHASLKQDMFDLVMRMFKGINISGRITAAMDVSLGKHRLVTSAYYDMITSLGGSDLTRQLYVEEAGRLSGYHDEERQRLAFLRLEMTSRRDERDNIIMALSPGIVSSGDTRLRTTMVALNSLGLEYQASYSQLRTIEASLRSLKDEEERQIGDNWPRLEAS